MKIIILGSGTSTGIPQIGCKCRTCTSQDPKDKRLRASILIQSEDKNILIDSGPDLRQQLIPLELSRLDAILLTHEHYDHTGGLDDVRPFGRINIYGENKVLDTVRRNMPYCFNENRYPGVPRLELNPISVNKFKIGNSWIEPIRIMHAQLPILGYRIGKMAYLTDVKTIPEESYCKLKDLDLLIISSLRIQEHFSHANLEESLDFARKIAARRTMFIHMSHDMGLHEEVNCLLPENIELSFDGLTITLPD